MRYLSLAIALCIVWSGYAAAQGGMMPGPGTVHSTVVGGPCDIVSFKGWYGLRACGVANKTGSQKAVNIQRASDSTTTDILILSSGAFDISTATTFCAATTCKVLKLYDQSGNGNDLTTPTSSKLSLGISGCIGTSVGYCLDDGAGGISGTLSSTAITYMETVFLQTANFTSNQNFLSTASSGNAPSVGNGPSLANTAYVYSGSVLGGTATNSAGHVLQGVYGTSGVLSIDNVETTGTTSAPAAQTVFNVGPTSGGFNQLMYEAGFSTSSPSAGTRTAVCHDAFVAWGTSVSC